MPRHRATKAAKNAKRAKDARGNAGAATRKTRNRPSAGNSPELNATTPPVPKHRPWIAAEAAVVGGAHLRAIPPRPCQDAALADADGRAIALICDGAGSAPASHIGANAVTLAIRRLCRTLETDIAAVLDHSESRAEAGAQLAKRMVTHAQGTLDDLAAQESRDPVDFRCTLLLWIAGLHRALWVKVGDGALVVQSSAGITCVGPGGKGEFANQTCFVGPHLLDSQWMWGGVSAQEVTGFAAMSDGAAERLVASDGSRVAPALNMLLFAVAKGEVGRRELFALLAEANFWRGTTGDDKSLAVLARDAIAICADV